MVQITLLSLEQLAQHCSLETTKYLQRQPSDSRFGFELMRRALLEENHEAFAYMTDVYTRQVRAWVYGHSKFINTQEEANYFVNAAFSTFFCALRGQKFARFSNLAPLLAYLKVCVHSAIMQYLRDQQSSRQLSFEQAGELLSQDRMEERVDSIEVWEYISTLLPDMRSRKLAYMALVQDLKPRQIVAVLPQEWYTERDVSVALYRIRQTLRNDDRLRQLIGLDLQELAYERAV